MKNLFHKKDKEHKDPKEEIAALEKEIESLKKDNAEQALLIQDTILTKDKEFAEVKKENRAFKEKFKASDTELTKLKKEHEEVTVERDNYLKEKMELDKQVKKLTFTNKNFEEEKQNLIKDNEEYKIKFENLVKEKLEAERQVDLYKNILKEKEENAMNIQKQDDNELRAQKEKTEKEFKDLFIQYQQVSKELRQLQDTYDKEKVLHEQRIIEIQRHLDEKNTQLERNKAEKENMMQRNKEETKKLMERNAEERKNLIQQNMQVASKNEELRKGEGDEYDKALIDILSDYLLKTSSDKLSVSLFDLLQTIIINIQLFDEIFQNSDEIEAANEIPLLLYSEINRYILQNFQNIDNIKLNDFLLSSKFITQMNIDKSAILKIKYFNDKHPKITEIYKVKRDRMNKLAESNFDVIKNFIKGKVKAEVTTAFSSSCELVKNVVAMNEDCLEIDFTKLDPSKKTKEISYLIPNVIKDALLFAVVIFVLFLIAFYCLPFYYKMNSLLGLFPVLLDNY